MIHHAWVDERKRELEKYLGKESSRNANFQLTFEGDGGDGIKSYGTRARIEGGTNKPVGNSFDARERQLSDPLCVFTPLVCLTGVAVRDVADVDVGGRDLGEAVEEVDGLRGHEAVRLEHERGELVVGLTADVGVVVDFPEFRDGRGVACLDVRVALGLALARDGVREGDVNDEAVVERVHAGDEEVADGVAVVVLVASTTPEEPSAFLGGVDGYGVDVLALLLVELASTSTSTVYVYYYYRVYSLTENTNPQGFPFLTVCIWIS